MESDNKSKSSNTRSRKTRNKRVEWRVIDRRVKGNAGLEISELPLDIPRYSFRVGKAHVDRTTGKVRIDNRLSTFIIYDALDLLKAAADEYTEKREAIIEEVEQLKANLQTE